MNHASEGGGWETRVSYLLQPRTNHGFRNMEGPFTTFGTSLSYHAIRILGMGASGRDHGSWPFA